VKKNPKIESHKDKTFDDLDIIRDVMGKTFLHALYDTRDHNIYRFYEACRWRITVTLSYIIMYVNSTIRENIIFGTLS